MTGKLKKSILDTVLYCIFNHEYNCVLACLNKKTAALSYQAIKEFLKDSKYMNDGIHYDLNDSQLSVMFFNGSSITIKAYNEPN